MFCIGSTFVTCAMHGGRAQVMMLGGRRKSRRERRLAAAEALEDARAQDGTAAEDAAVTLAGAAAQDSDDHLIRTGIERAQPKPHRSQRTSAGAAAAQHQRMPQKWTFDGNSSRGGEAVQPVQWPPRDAVQPSRRTDANDRVAAARRGADRDHAVKGSVPHPVAKAAGINGQPGIRSDSEPVTGSPQNRRQAGPATAPGWNFGSWWQSLSALKPKKSAQQAKA